MFKFVYGFTMAEVLITLGVIGIVDFAGCNKQQP